MTAAPDRLELSGRLRERPAVTTPTRKSARSATTARSAGTPTPISVRPVDTVGAGDGFAAGYLAAYLNGGGLPERVDQAAAVGAFVTTRRGDLAAMPTASELRDFCAS